MSKVLVTGFGPYADTPTNPAQFAAEAVDGMVIAGATVVSRIVPGAYFDSIAATVQALEEEQPELLIMLGEFGGRAMITVERLAQNVNDCARYGVTDTAGKVLSGEPTATDGPVAYWATTPNRGDGHGDAPGRSPRGPVGCRRHLCLQPPDVRDAAPHRATRPADPRGLAALAVLARGSRTRPQPGRAEHVGGDVGFRCRCRYRGSPHPLHRYHRTLPISTADLA